MELASDRVRLHKFSHALISCAVYYRIKYLVFQTYISFLKRRFAMK